MGIIDISLRARRRAHRHSADVHLYVVGQVVRLRTAGPRTARTAEIFRITGKLPANGGRLQYRLRNMTERFERVVTQDTIEPLIASNSSAPSPLADSVFGGGAAQEPDAEGRPVPAVDFPRDA